MDYKWHSVFRNSVGKVSAMEIGFLLWMLALSISLVVMCVSAKSLSEIPTSVVHLTLALGATKVTHKLAENNWGKILVQIVGFFKEKKKKISKDNSFSTTKKLTKNKKTV